MKERVHAMWMMTLLFTLAASTGWAQIDGLANTSKQGSLLIWPWIQTTGGETYVTIANHSVSSVSVKCYWQLKEVRTNPKSQCLLYDFTMLLGGSSTLVFRASDGSGLDGRVVTVGMGAPEEGALSCWAVDPSGHKQISWNHLGGSAVVVNGDSFAPDATGRPTSSWEYSAWRFAANVIDSSGEWADGFWVGHVAGIDGPVNTLNLKASPTTIVAPANCPGPDYSASGCHLPAAVYDACPKYQTFDFLANSSAPAMADGFAYNTVALVPCKADLTGPTLNLRTSLVYTIWNGKSVRIGGLSRCANALSRSDLGALSIPRRLMIFRYRNLHTPSGRFRVEGKANSACAPDSVATPLLGVLWSRLSDGSGTVGSNGSSNGKETTDWGYISWQPEGDYYQAPRRPAE